MRLWPAYSMDESIARKRPGEQCPVYVGTSEEPDLWMMRPDFDEACRERMEHDA